MAIEIVHVLYAGPVDPDDPRERRSVDDKSNVTEYIEITASYHNLSQHSGAFSLDHLITAYLPRAVIEGLEEAIFRKTGFRPVRRDLLSGSPQDTEDNYRFAYRHMTYFSVDPSQKKGRLTKEESAELLEMHRKMYPVYKEFLESIKYRRPGKNGNGHTNGNGTNGKNKQNGKNGHSKNSKNGTKK